jgi:hypothetical protein
MTDQLTFPDHMTSIPLTVIKGKGSRVNPDQTNHLKSKNAFVRPTAGE